MLDWWSIEVLDGAELSAAGWWRGHGETLIEAAITNGAEGWDNHPEPWGVVFEIAFSDVDAWSRFRQLPAVSAALDAVPDRVNGLFVHRGRGGSSGRPLPRRPHPFLGSDAAELPVPQDEVRLDLTAEDLTAGDPAATRAATVAVAR